MIVAGVKLISGWMNPKDDDNRGEIFHVFFKKFSRDEGMCIILMMQGLHPGRRAGINVNHAQKERIYDKRSEHGETRDGFE